MGHNSFIKGSITHVSLGFSHYLLVQLHLVERGKTSVPGAGGALGSNQHRWSDAPPSRPLWPNGRPSECGASTLWINTIPTTTTKKPNKTKKVRAGTWSHSGADQLGSRWSLNYNVLPMTHTHTPLHSLFTRSFF